MSLANCSKTGSTSLDPMSFGGDHHMEAMMERMRYQRETGRFCDVCVCIIVKERRFNAHRTVLAACSPYFDTILRHNQAVKEQVVVNCDDASVFERILAYMYMGSVTIDRGVCAEMLRLANSLLMIRLKQHCADYLEHYLDASNCLGVKELAMRYNLARLVQKADEFFHSNLNACLVESADLPNFRFARIKALLGDPIQKEHILPETHLNLVVRWSASNSAEREEFFGELLENCRVGEVALSTIKQMIDHHPYFNQSPKSLYRLLHSMRSVGVMPQPYEPRYWELADQFQQHAAGSNIQGANGIAAAVQNRSSLSGHKGQRESMVEGEICENPYSDAGTSQRLFHEGATNGGAQPPRPSLKLKIHLGQAPDASSQRNSDIHTRANEKGKRRKTGLQFYRKELVSADQNQAVRKRGRPPKVRAPLPIPNEREAENETRASFFEFHDDPIAIVLFDEEDDINPDELYVISEEGPEDRGQEEEDRHESLPQLQCPHCPYKGRSQQKLVRHQAVAHSKNVTYVCDLCRYECHWNRAFYEHMRQEHFKGPPFQCDSCAYTVDRINVLLSHRLTHGQEKPFKCSQCDFRARSKANLIIHSRYHSGERPFECKQCGKGFAMKCSLDQHANSHLESRPFACSYCSFTTKYQSHLISHRRIHSGDTFRCEVSGCGYSSPKKSQLAAHLRTHLAVRSHQCNHCRRSFVEKSHLIRHQRIHLSDKPFKCDECDYTSARRDKLKEHVLKYHTSSAKQDRRRYRRARQLAQLVSQLQLPIPEHFDFRPIGKDHQAGEGEEDEAENGINKELERIERNRKEVYRPNANPQHRQSEQMMREEQRRQQQIRRNTINYGAFPFAEFNSQPLQQQQQLADSQQHLQQPMQQLLQNVTNQLQLQQQQQQSSMLNRPSSASLAQQNPIASFSPSCFSLHDFHTATGEVIFNASNTPDTEHTELTTPVDLQLQDQMGLVRSVNPPLTGHPANATRYSFAHQITFDGGYSASQCGELSQQQLEQDLIPRPLSLPNYGQGGGSNAGGGSGGNVQHPGIQMQILDDQLISHQGQVINWSLHVGEMTNTNPPF